ncbi:lipopolysaccharide biosynthesis protein [Butyrivibrio sp. NC3005]|uniref:lipopolysaccharide biosynthesis protein n=1 Tax=Butyrivibrio sp. NC3005 TaxID=1280685 RepID=UPI0003FB05D7|nr:polysaccharide biosynthesis protein [Butyrivibrio sp. NC3005]
MDNQSRVKNTIRNIFFGYLGTLITSLLGFVSRKLFILKLSDTLLGVNGFYTGILSTLSLAELGIGTALNFSLYKPIAEGNTEEIKSYMALYKKAYRIIALVVAVIGVMLIPFLRLMASGASSVSDRDLICYYLIFLFNSATSYLVAYKYSLVNAEQKTYIQTNIITITKMISVTMQIVVLFLTSSFYAYLLTDLFIGTVQKIFVSKYLGKMYPYLEEKDVKPLTKKQKDEVKGKTSALLWLKIGDTARLQTDSVIITTFIGVLTTGVVDNFNMVINTVSSFVNTIFNSALPGFGNLIATESRNKQYEMFKVYRFFAVWIYGFSAVGFYILLSPLIQILYGQKWSMGANIMVWIIIEYYLKGERIVVNNFKTAAGKFEQDKYLAMIQGIVNLVISIVLAIKIGLAGVYIGTVVSGVIANFVRPVIIYRECFGQKSLLYFLDSVKYHVVLILTLFLSAYLSKLTLPRVNLINFLITGIMITVVYNGIFLVSFGKCKEFGYLYSIFTKRIRKK